MKKVRYFYWLLAVVGFILPISRTILLQLPHLCSALFSYLFSFGFKTKGSISLIELSIALISLIALSIYLYQLIRLSFEATSKTKRSYIIATCGYSIVGSSYFLLMHTPLVQMGMIAFYFIILVFSTDFIRLLK